jgi:hypothetical protein
LAAFEGSAKYVRSLIIGFSTIAGPSSRIKGTENVLEYITMLAVTISRI